jgi:nicotinamide-nucleotide amidase
MAQGAIRHSGADVAVSISGVAGPDGGTELKPVGPVVFARADRGNDEVNAEEKRLDGKTRAEIRYQATLVALELLLP